MQTVWSRIWTRVTVSISHDKNYVICPDTDSSGYSVEINLKKFLKIKLNKSKKRNGSQFFDRK